ncbi:hypothetical protein PCHDK_000546600, partial [Plasmodium chabaudi adami]
IKKLHSTSLTNLEDNYNKYSSFLKEIINNIITDSKKVEPPSESGGEKDDQLPSPKDSHQTLSDTPQLPQEPSGKVSSDQTGQEGPEKPVEDHVIKSENPGSDVKGNGTIGIGGEKDDQLPSPKDSHQTLSDTPQLPQEPSGKVSSDQTGQEGPEKPVEDHVIKSENPGSDVKGNGTIG